MPRLLTSPAWIIISPFGNFSLRCWAWVSDMATIFIKFKIGFNPNKYMAFWLYHIRFIFAIAVLGMVFYYSFLACHGQQTACNRRRCLSHRKGKGIENQKGHIPSQAGIGAGCIGWLYRPCGKPKGQDEIFPIHAPQTGAALECEYVDLLPPINKWGFSYLTLLIIRNHCVYLCTNTCTQWQ